MLGMRNAASTVLASATLLLSAALSTTLSRPLAAATDAPASPTAAAALPAVAVAHPKWEPCLPFVPKGCEVALVKGDYTRGASQIIYRMPANFSVPAHWHTSAERMVVMAGKIRMSYAGREPEVFEIGDTTSTPGKLPHAAFCLRGTPCVVLVEYDLPFDAVPVAPAK